MSSSYVPRRPDYVVGYIDRITGRKHANVGGGWIVEQGRIRVKLNVVVPVGQVVVLFPNQYKDEPVGTKRSARENFAPCAQCGSSERCWCNSSAPESEGPDGVPYVYHDDCEGIQ